MTDPQTPDSEGGDNTLDLSALQDLSFGPAWGAGMPGAGRSSQAEKRTPGRGSDRGERRERPAGGRRERRRDGGSDGGTRPDRRSERPARDRRPVEEAAPFKPVVAVDFYPEDEPFEILMKGFKTSLRTYELFELARIFLDKADRFVFVVEPLAEGEGLGSKLYLSLPSKVPFLNESEAIEHALAAELESRLEPFEVEVDPPKGNFQVIHRCGLTGKLIGPPNYHRYQELLREHHATNVANTSFEKFRDRLVSEKEQAVIDEWVQSQSKQTRYRLKAVVSPAEETKVAVSEDDAPKEESETVAEAGDHTDETVPEAIEPSGEDATEESAEPEDGAEASTAEPQREFATLAEARQYFKSERKEEFVQSFAKLRLNGKVIEAMPHGPLRRSIEVVWEDQKRFPLQTANNLRGKLRRANCHIYKRGKKGISFVCAVRRRMRDPRAVYADSVQRLIDFLDASPRTKVGELSGKLLGISKEGMDTSFTPEEREEADKQLRQLGRDLLWLKSEGYVSEFSDGTLLVQPFASGAGVEDDGNQSESDPVFSTDSEDSAPDVSDKIASD